MSLSSDKSFLTYIRERKQTLWIILILLIALVVIFISSSDTATTSDDDSLEARVSALCESIADVGECRVLIYYKPQTSRYDDKKVESVVVVCEGADSLSVRKTLTDMLSAFFGIGSNRVVIEKMKN